jgi:hypothetical protein
MPLNMPLKLFIRFVGTNSTLLLLAINSKDVPALNPIGSNISFGKLT